MGEETYLDDSLKVGTQLSVFLERNSLTGHSFFLNEFYDIGYPRQTKSYSVWYTHFIDLAVVDI